MFTRIVMIDGEVFNPDSIIKMTKDSKHRCIIYMRDSRRCAINMSRKKVLKELQRQGVVIGLWEAKRNDKREKARRPRMMRGSPHHE